MYGTIDGYIFLCRFVLFWICLKLGKIGLVETKDGLRMLFPTMCLLSGSLVVIITNKMTTIYFPPV